MSEANQPIPAGRRPVRSFVLRQGRLTPAQARALAQHGDRYLLALPADNEPALDLDAVFDRRAPRVLEIGFGNGDALLATASAEPDKDFIGIEVHGPGVGRLLKNAAEAGTGNLRVVQHDAVEVLEHALPPASLDEIRVFFPDPWPKKKHHKRRLIQPGFVALLHSRLRPGGRLHLATDWPPYAEHMLAVLSAAPGLRNLAGNGGFVPRPESRPLTHFEQRGLKLGHPVFDLLFQAVPA